MVKTKKAVTVIKKQEVKPLSPIAVSRQLKVLDELYENTGMSSDAYQESKAKLVKALEAWGKQ